MTLEKLMEILDAKLLTDSDVNQQVSCAFGCDLISDILMCAKEKTLLLTGLTNPQIIRVSDMIDLEGIVFVRGKNPTPEIIEMAQQRGLPVLSTEKTLYQACGLLYSNDLRSCKVQ